MQLIIKQQTGKKDDQCAVFVHCTHNCKFDTR